MTGLLPAVLAALPGSAIAQIGGCVPDESGPVLVEIDTRLGPILVQLFPATAPITVQNFLDYAADGAYDDGVFHRVVPEFVIQAGSFRSPGGGAYEPIPTRSPIVSEPCLSNTRGTIAMARLSGDPNSATSGWFINQVDNGFLDGVDGGFTAFGRVHPDSLDVVDAIAGLPIYDASAILEQPVNGAFQELAVEALPVDPPGGYGCSRASPVFGLVDPTGSFVELDPLRSGGGLNVPILLDPICTGADAPGPPSIPCTPGVGRTVVDLPGLSTLFPMSCAAVAESEAAWAARRTGTDLQLRTQDVDIVSVPEPNVPLALLLGTASLLLPGRRRQPRKRPRATSGRFSRGALASSDGGMDSRDRR